jgi:iron complex outermembrane receptor protein
MTPCDAGVQSATGGFTGIITGPDGARLPGAAVSIRGLESGTVVRIVTGGQGVYRAANLVPGRYEFTAELEGFQPTVMTDVPLSEGETRTVDLTLAIATIREIVTVVGTLPRASIEAAEVRESSARDVGEALAGVGGVWKVRKGGIASDVVLRGFQSKDLNVLIDGQRIYGACPNQMDPPAFHADFAEVERVEVGKGPFDIKNQGSLGGVVNIVTRQSAPGFHADANLSAGSFAYFNPSARASYGTGRFSALGGYSYRLSEPYRDGSGKRFTEYTNYRANVLDSDAFRIGTAWAKLSGSPWQNHLVQLSYTRQEADHVLYPYLQMDATYDNADRVNFGYQVDRPSSLMKSLRIQGYLTEVRHWMTDEYRTSSNNVPLNYSMGTMAQTRAYGGKIEGGLRDFLVGVEAFERQWDAVTRLAGSAYQPQFSIPDVGITSIGIYAEYAKPLTDRLRINLGARFDRARSAADPSKANLNLYYAYNSTTRTSVTDTYPSATARLSYRASDTFEFRGSFGRTVRVPDARERFFALRRMGSDWVGNPELAPSRNTGADAAVTFRHHGLLVESSLYLNQVGDFVTVLRQQKANAAPGVMNSNSRSYQNVDARIYGTDLDLAYSLTRRIFLSGNIAYVRGSEDPVPQKGIFSSNLAEMPPLSSRAGIRFDNGILTGEIEGVFVSSQTRVNTDLREEPTPGYGMANLKVGANYRRFWLRVGLDNLFDRSFYEHLSYQRDPFRSGVRVREPGRNLYVNLSFHF